MKTHIKLPRILIALTLGMLNCSAWADVPIRDGSFEKCTVLGPSVKMEEIVNDLPKLAAVMGNWYPVAWGTPEATRNALSIVSMPDAPDGKHVAQVDNLVNQISVFAYLIPQHVLTPGQWYEASCRIRTEDLQGQGAFLMAEFWDGAYGNGGVDSEHLVGTNAWQNAIIHFQAPKKGFHVKLSLWVFGGPGKAWFDDVKLRGIVPPKVDISQRRVLDEPFWGMFTCLGNYLAQYGQDMKNAGVHWQRQGLGGLGSLEFMENVGMVYEMCFDGVPGPNSKDDPLWPISETAAAQQFAIGAAQKASKCVHIFEMLNEPNTQVPWTLPAYANLLNVVGKAVKSVKPDVLFATGGFACPYVGYAEACLKRDPEKVVDIILFHPYCVDESLDSQLTALAEACDRVGRPEVALAINEIGFPTWDPATGHPVNEWFVSEADQASKVLKCHIQAIAHKLSFVTYLAWNDIAPEKTDQAKNMGLIRVDGSEKPSLRAYKFMVNTLGPKPRIAKQEYQKNGTRVYTITGAKDMPVWVVWNALQDAETAVDVGARKVFLCDMYGTKQTVTPSTGVVNVKAGNFPVFLVCEE